jgi:selenocysteine-specific elongation factor
VILRAYAAAHANVEGLTVGGGVVIDPLPERREPGKRVALARALSSNDPAARALALVVDAGGPGIDPTSVAVRGRIEDPLAVLTRLAKPGGPVLELGGRFVDRSLLAALEQAAIAEADRFHRQHPLQPGIARATLEGSLPGHPSAELARAAVDAVIQRGALQIADRQGSLARPGKGRLDPAALPEPMQHTLALYRQGALSPPTLRDVSDKLALEPKRVLELVALLQRNGLLVRVSDDLSYASEAHVELLRRVRAHLATHGELDVQALKDMTGLSRKFVVPFLEHLDHLGVTRREGDRRLPGPKAAAD